MTLVYALESIHIASGDRSELPWRFPSMAEAQEKVAELASAEFRLMVKLVPEA